MAAKEKETKKVAKDLKEKGSLGSLGIKKTNQPNIYIYICIYKCFHLESRTEDSFTPSSVL